MAHSHHRVAEYHPRFQKAHDCADFFSHFNANLLIGVLIAVYLTIRAKCLLGCIGVALGGIGGSPSAPACFPVPPACGVLFCQELGKAEPLVYRDKTV